MESAFDQLYNTYYMQVYSFVLTLSKSQALSEEVTQKTFFKAMSASSKYRGESSEFTWLCAIAKNLYLDEVRHQKRTESISGNEVSDTDIEGTLADEDALFRIHQALHDLKEPYKEVFQLRVFGELPFQKIGMLFQKTENWARVTYHRARLMIQERMER